MLAQAETGNALGETAPTIEVEEVGEPNPLTADEQELHATTEADGDAHHSDVFPPFDATTFGDQLLWLAICFAFLYVVMSRMALPRIGGILEQRKARIEGDLAAADYSRKKTDAAIAAYEAALAEARAKAQAMAEETRTSIKADIDGKRAQVEQDLARKLEDAEARIAATKAQALANVDEIAADTVQALVGQLTGEVSQAEAREAVSQVSKE
ncbi:F0F1 ATP synthase subunit B [Arsenicitalea aurantiaca]|uniref:F0F1 ATP synthase subunit B n=1 Tax=Arsenicitalea aurantiaca TaxID=1783274 RepID=UPI001FCE5736|nr:F0F1 ATP synthase subunit B [Arsenicitalea aurantiaca]